MDKCKPLELGTLIGGGAAAAALPPCTGRPSAESATVGRCSLTLSNPR